MPCDRDRGFSATIIRPRWDAFGTVNARLLGSGVLIVLRDSADAVVREKEALVTCNPSRAARTEPGFRFSVGEDRGMFAMSAASSIAADVTMLGIREG